MVAANGTGQPQLVVDEHKTILEEVPREENGTLSAANYAGCRPQIMVQRIRRLTFHWQRTDHPGRTYKMSTQGHENVAAEYYKQQVEMLEGFSEMDAFTYRAFLPVMSKEEQEKVVRSESLAIWLSNIANMVLFAAKVYASVRSGSLAIIASTLDSLLDLLS
eukprot:XP_020398340.1 metal tolerance protein 5-like isoform X1 [Zea mays]